MSRFREFEAMPDFEASPVRRPHSYEAADVAAMSAATPMPKPMGRVGKPVMGERFRGPMPEDTSVPMPKPAGRRTPVRNTVNPRPGLDRNRPRYGKY